MSKVVRIKDVLYDCLKQDATNVAEKPTEHLNNILKHHFGVERIKTMSVDPQDEKFDLGPDSEL